MYAAGIDLGTTFTKLHTGIAFPSGISEDVYNWSNSVISVDGKQYTMELFNSLATYDINVNKGLNRNARLNFIYGLWKLSRDFSEEYIPFESVTVGLPGGQWKNTNVVNQFKELLNLSKPVEIEGMGVKKKLQVERIDVVPEGSTAYYMISNYEQKYKGDNVLLLDWGGLTLNENLFQNDEIIDVDTDEYGVLKVYKDMAGAINSFYGTNVKTEEMFDILTKGLFIKGKNHPVKDIVKQPALKYCEKVYRSLKLKWSIDTVPHIPLVGAGSITMNEYIKEFIPHAELQENAQTLAARGMSA